MSNLLTPEQAAQFLGIKASTLSVWRCTKKVNVPFVKIGASVRYTKEALENFVSGNTSIH